MSAMNVYGAPVADLSHLAAIYRSLGRISTCDLSERKQAQLRAIIVRARELQAEACHEAGLEPGEITSKQLWTGDGGIDEYASKLERCGISLPLEATAAVEGTPVAAASALVVCLLELAWLSADKQMHPLAFIAALSPPVR